MAAYWEIVAHSAYDMFSWYKYLSVILAFSHPLVFGVGISFLIVPFPDLCLLVLFPPASSYTVYISTHCFLRVSGHDADFNIRNTSNPINYPEYHKLCKAFSKLF